MLKASLGRVSGSMLSPFLEEHSAAVAGGGAQ